MELGFLDLERLTVKKNDIAFVETRLEARDHFDLDLAFDAKCANNLANRGSFRSAHKTKTGQASMTCPA